MKILDRLKQESTWRGLIALAAVFGVNVSPEPELAVKIASVAMGIIGLINVSKGD